MAIAKKPLSELQRLTKVIRDFAVLREKDQSLPVPQEILDIVRESGAEEAVRLTFETRKDDDYPEWVSKPKSAEDAISNYIEQYVLRFNRGYVHPMLWPTPPSMEHIYSGFVPIMNAIREQHGYLPINYASQEISNAGGVRIEGPRALIQNALNKDTTVIFSDLAVLPGSFTEELQYCLNFQAIGEQKVEKPQVWVNSSIELFQEIGIRNSVVFPAGAKLFTVKMPPDWKTKLGKSPKEIESIIQAIAKEKAPEAFLCQQNTSNEYTGVGVLLENHLGHIEALVVVSGVIDTGRPVYYRSDFSEPGDAIRLLARWLPNSTIAIATVENAPKNRFRGFSREEYLEIATKKLSELGLIGFACASSYCFVGVPAADVVGNTDIDASEVVRLISCRYYSDAPESDDDTRPI